MKSSRVAASGLNAGPSSPLLPVWSALKWLPPLDVEETGPCFKGGLRW